MLGRPTFPEKPDTSSGLPGVAEQINLRSNDFECLFPFILSEIHEPFGYLLASERLELHALLEHRHIQEPRPRRLELVLAERVRHDDLPLGGLLGDAAEAEQQGPLDKLIDAREKP